MASADGATVASRLRRARYRASAMPVTVIARFQVRPGREADAEAALGDLIAATHDEAGCLACALHRDAGDRRALVIVERWTSPVALDNHDLQPHAAAFRDRAGELFEETPEVRVLEPVPAGDPMKGSL